MEHSWPHLDTQPTDDTTLRHEQLRMRVAETHVVLRAMRGEDVINECDSNKCVEGKNRVRAQEGRGCGDALGTVEDWAELQGHVDASRPVIVGHSLGGSAAVSILHRGSLEWCLCLRLCRSWQQQRGESSTFPL